MTFSSVQIEEVGRHSVVEFQRESVKREWMNFFHNSIWMVGCSNSLVGNNRPWPVWWGTTPNPVFAGRGIVTPCLNRTSICQFRVFFDIKIFFICYARFSHDENVLSSKFWLVWRWWRVRLECRESDRGHRSTDTRACRGSGTKARLDQPKSSSTFRLFLNSCTPHKPAK